jgi:ATP-dependent Lon protease
MPDAMKDSDPKKDRPAAQPARRPPPDGASHQEGKSESASAPERKESRSTEKPERTRGPEASGGDPVPEVPAGIPEVLPILPTRGVAVFPGIISSLSIGRPASRKLLEESLPQSKIIGVIAQKDPEIESPGPRDLYRVGVAVSVLKLLRQPDDGGVVIVVSALSRFRIKKTIPGGDFLRAEIELLTSTPPPEDDKQWQAMVQQLRDSALQLIALAPDAPAQAAQLIRTVDDPGMLADLIANSLNLDSPQRQDLLEELDVVKRVRAVLTRVTAQLEIARLQQKIQKDVAQSFTDAQRRAFLREQVKTIQKELGESDGGPDQVVEELRKKVTDANPPKEIADQAERELKRLGQLHPASAEFPVIVSYVETLAELPWTRLTEDNLDLDRAQEILDRDHFDLEKIKRRLIEYLAVRKLNPTGQGPILCLVGPPGVGKTSLGQSIADALGRKFVRIGLGGMRDEAEIRGHRRTYVGAMPGRIIQELRRAGSRNPVMMLDEIDKLGSDFRGDPASALLEVLDPRQNRAFVDHYLAVPFDLSQVIFIATANEMDPVPPALRDRMEVIRLAGYSDREKLEIAKRYIVPRQVKENGLQPEQCRIDDDALMKTIEDYTREAGVRELERRIGAICRSVAAMFARGKQEKAVHVEAEMVHSILGPPRYVREARLKTNNPGVVTGLAWTSVGGEILHIEALRYPGKGGIMLTGQIGDVMKESVHAAMSLVKSRAEALGIERDAFKDVDVHIHVPAGAVPKDGPSAGVAMFTAIASLFTERPVRADVAMTGEISLRGLVLPIGGLKEKSLAALRAEITTVIVPKLNEKDLVDIPAEVKEKIEFVLAETVDDVLATALEEAQVGAH